MIRRMQILKKRHGFTLVELIAVVAIIGVLAAILTPFLFGMVTKARVSSVNSTAGSISRYMNAFFVQAEADGWGVKPGTACTIQITVSKDGGKPVWKCVSLDADSFMVANGTEVRWSSGGTFTEGESLSGENRGQVILMAELSEQLSNISTAYISITMIGAKCTYVVYCADTGAVLSDGDYPKPVDGHPPENFAWGSVDGMSESGHIIGTSPVVPGV